MELKIRNTGDLPEVAKEFVKAMAGRMHFAFVGSMGAGKTTFISELCKALGSADEASSPTFSIVNEYDVPGKLPIYHFDFYRVESEAELIDMGVEDYWDNGSVCFVEWPEMAVGYLPEDLVTVKISVNDDLSRILEFDEDNLD